VISGLLFKLLERSRAATFMSRTSLQKVNHPPKSVNMPIVVLCNESPTIMHSKMLLTICGWKLVLRLITMVSYINETHFCVTYYYRITHLIYSAQQTLFARCCISKSRHSVIFLYTGFPSRLNKR